MFDFQRMFCNREVNLQRISNMLFIQESQIFKIHKNNSLSYMMINDDEKNVLKGWVAEMSS